MLLRYDQLSLIRKKHPSKRIVLGSGTFDLFHAAHLNYLEEVHKHGDIMVVMVNGDERVRSAKGSDRPVIPAEERARIVDALHYVDYVLIVPHEVQKGAEGDPVIGELFSIIQPDVFVTSNTVWRSWQKLPLFEHTELVVKPRHAGTRFESTSDIIKHLSGHGPVSS